MTKRINPALRWVLRIALFLSAVILIKEAISCSYRVNTLVSHAKTSKAKFPAVTDTYKEVFPNYDSTLTVPFYTFYSAHRNPIGTFQLDKKYTLLAHKISNVPQNARLKDLVEINWTKAREMTNDIVYQTSFRRKYIDFALADAPDQPVEKLEIAIEGKIIGRAIVSDSLLYYKVNLEQMTGHNIPGTITDFRLARKRNVFGIAKGEVEVEIVFLKKNNQLFLIALFSDLKPRLLESPVLPNLLISNK